MVIYSKLMVTCRKMSHLNRVLLQSTLSGQPAATVTLLTWNQPTLIIMN